MALEQNIKKYAKKGIPFMTKYLKKQDATRKDAVLNAVANVMGRKGKPKRERISQKVKNQFDKQTKCKCCTKHLRHPEYHHLDCNPKNSNNASNILKMCSDCHKDIHQVICEQLNPLIKKLNKRKGVGDGIDKINQRIGKSLGF